MREFFDSYYKNGERREEKDEFGSQGVEASAGKEEEKIVQHSHEEKVAKFVEMGEGAEEFKKRVRDPAVLKNNGGAQQESETEEEREWE